MDVLAGFDLWEKQGILAQLLNSILLHTVKHAYACINLEEASRDKVRTPAPGSVSTSLKPIASFQCYIPFTFLCATLNSWKRGPRSPLIAWWIYHQIAPKALIKLAICGTLYALLLERVLPIKLPDKMQRCTHVALVRQKCHDPAYKPPPQFAQCQHAEGGGGRRNRGILRCMEL